MNRSDHLILSKIYIYPIKSLGEIALEEARIDDFGLKYDRRWMLIDENNTFITQRQFPELCFFMCELINDAIIVSHKELKDFKVFIPLRQDVLGERITVKVWGDFCDAYEVNTEVSKAFSEVLRKQIKLVYMPADVRRQVDRQYAPEKVYTSFTDGFPILMIGEESLNELNGKLKEPVGMLRFRPNLVFSGGYPFIEDTMKHISVGEARLEVVKPCSRCVVTTIDRQTGRKGIEPLKTLADFRLKDNKVLFGQNVIVNSGMTVKIGDEINLLD